MGRLITLGFEQNNNTVNGEWSDTNDSPTIQTTTVRSGTYAGQITSLTSGTRRGWGYRFQATQGATAHIYVRIYLRVATRPSADNIIFAISDTGSPFNTNMLFPIKLASDGTLKLFNGVTQIGSASSVLSLDTWYYVEIEYDTTPSAGSDVLKARLNGVEFAAASNLTMSSNATGFVVGGNLDSEAQTTGNWYFDDCAVNSTTGSTQNSYPGEEEYIILKPDAAGDNEEWGASDASTKTGTDYAQVDEVTPDDATSYIASRTQGVISDYNLEATPAALASDDTINFVTAGVRFRKTSTAGDPFQFKTRVKASSGGTVEESSAIIYDATTWRSYSPSIPYNYSFVLYDLPGASTTAWTKSDLDTTQIGVNHTFQDGQDVNVSTLWLGVGHKPEEAAPPGGGEVSGGHLALMGVG